MTTEEKDQFWRTRIENRIKLYSTGFFFSSTNFIVNKGPWAIFQYKDSGDFVLLHCCVAPGRNEHNLNSVHTGNMECTECHDEIPEEFEIFFNMLRRYQ